MTVGEHTVKESIYKMFRNRGREGVVKEWLLSPTLAGVKFMYREINDLLKTTPQVDGTEN